MGSCSSSDAEMPVSAIGIEKMDKKVLSIEKRTVKPPVELGPISEAYTSNGKITDFITKSVTPVRMTYQQLNIEDSLDSKRKFVDKAFPTSKDSLGPQPYPEKVEWKRAEQFLGQECKVFQGEISPFDIKQGRLGDCYFLSAIASISEYPFIVKRLFETIEISSFGYYGVWLFIDGMWRNIVVDDFFPVFGNKPFFTRDHRGELWVMLLEKAYAKVYGSYQSIESGLCGVGLNALTGAPYDYFCKDSKNSLDADEAWNFLTKHFDAQHLVCGSSENNDRNEYLGLVSGHAYTILEIQEVHIATKKGKTKERILKIQNPWGKYEWKGRWSDFSDVWSEQLRQQLKFEKADDGIFWINIADFIENFGQICACMYNKNYISTSLAISFPKQQQNSYKGIFLKAVNRTEGYLTITQQDHRKFPKSYKYSLVQMVLLKIDKSSGTIGTYISDHLDCDKDATLKVELDPGDYFLLLEIGWNCGHTRNVVVNFYGQHPVGLVEDKEQFDPSALFDEIVVLHEKHTQKQRIYEYPKDPQIKRVTGSIAGYTYYHYVNKSTDNNYVCESVQLKQRRQIQVIGQPDPTQFIVKVYPGQERIVKLKAMKEGNGSYNYSTIIQYYIVQKYSLDKLKELADKKPTKIKKRQIDGKQIDVRVKTYNYTGGVVLLYQNKLDKYAYIEQIFFEIDNLILQNETMPQSHKLEIQLEPNAQKMLSFIVDRPGKEIVFKTKMSFYLNAPQFKF